MKKYILISLFLSFVLVACNKTSITNDPKVDARNMTEQLVKAAENNDIVAVDEMLGKYYEAYSKKDLADRVVFIQDGHDCEAFNKSDVWDNFTKSDEFKNSTNNKRFEILYHETRQEAERLGVW